MDKNINKRDNKRDYKIIAVTNNKGGVGKTFIATHIAWGLKRLFNLDTYLVDADAQQADAIKWATGYKVKDPEMFHTYTGVDGLDVVWTKDVLAPIENFKGDVIVIDGRPNVGVSSEVVRAADLVIFPVVGRLSIHNLQDLIDGLVSEVDIKKRLVVVNLQKAHTNLSKSQFDRAKLIHSELYTAPIPNSVRIGEAEKEGTNIWHVKGSPITESIEKFIGYVKEMLYGEDAT